MPKQSKGEDFCQKTLEIALIVIKVNRRLFEAVPAGNGSVGYFGMSQLEPYSVELQTTVRVRDYEPSFKQEEGNTRMV